METRKRKNSNGWVYSQKKDLLMKRNHRKVYAFIIRSVMYTKSSSGR